MRTFYAIAELTLSTGTTIMLFPKPDGTHEVTVKEREGDELTNTEWEEFCTRYRALKQAELL